jgi:hypothetical protein
MLNLLLSEAIVGIKVVVVFTIIATACSAAERVGSLRSPPVRTRRLTCGNTLAASPGSTNAVRTPLGRRPG